MRNPPEPRKEATRAKRKTTRTERKALLEQENLRLEAEAESRARLLSREAAWRAQQIRDQLADGTYEEPDPF